MSEISDYSLDCTTHSSFSEDLRFRVRNFLQSSNRDTSRHPQLYVKASILFTWLLASMVLVTTSHSLPLTLMAAVFAGMAMAGLGMNVQHDGGHRSFSRNMRVNEWAALVLDFLGGSSYVWRHKHGIAHHTYTNVDGGDEDIAVPFARLSPHQRHRWHHRFQHLYLPFLYSFMTLKWFWFDDYFRLWRGRVGHTKIKPPRGKQLVIFVSGKLIHALWVLVTPIVALGWWQGLAVYLVMSMVCSTILALVFQLAHCVELADFPVATSPQHGGRLDFMEHQVATTVDFSRHSRWLSWYLGGLNFQVEHHLFPRVCHVHYADLAPIIEQCCHQHGLAYRTYPSIWTAMASHYRWLARLGAGER